MGTPTRLNDLMDDGIYGRTCRGSFRMLTRHLGALDVGKLERIVIDASHVDQKKRGVLEIRETQIPLTQLLNRKELKNRYGQESNGIDLLFY